MAAPNSPHRWLLKWRLNRNIRYYVELATMDCRLFLDREPLTFRAALVEAGRWIVDYVKGRQPISWPERRYFVGAFRGFTPTKTAHERAFAEWLQTCWLADQYPYANISVSHQSLFSPELKARCAERETESLNQFLAAVPAYGELQWSEQHVSEDEEFYQAKLMVDVEFHKVELKRKLRAAATRMRKLYRLERHDFNVEAFIERNDMADGYGEDDRDDYEKAIDDYIERAYGFH